MKRKHERKAVLDERIQELQHVIEILGVLRDHPEIGEQKLCEEHGMSFTQYRKLAYDTDWLACTTKSANSEERTTEKMKKVKPTLSWYHDLWCTLMGLDYRDVAVCPTDVEETLEMLLKTRLKPRESDIIRMRYEEGLKYVEIGKSFGITGDRVSQIEIRALRKLKNCAGWLQFGKNHWVKAMKIQERIECNLEVTATHRVLSALDEKIPELRKLINDGIKYEIEQSQKSQNNLDRPITDMGLSTRSINCLTKAGITTINELSMMTEDDLMRIRNLGSGCIREIKARLGEYGFSLFTDESV